MKRKRAKTFILLKEQNNDFYNAPFSKIICGSNSFETIEKIEYALILEKEEFMEINNSRENSKRTFGEQQSL